MVSNIEYIGEAAESPDNVLRQAIGELESVVMIGWDKNGGIDVRASTNLSNSDVLWLIEHFKMQLLNGDYLD